MRLNRTDYYSSEGAFANVVDMMGFPLTAEMIAKNEDWLAFYNFACTIRKSS